MPDDCCGRYASMLRRRAAGPTDKVMNYLRRNIIPWAATICLLLMMVVLPVRGSAQVATSDDKSDTSTKHKKPHRKKLISTDSAAEPASTTSPPASAVSTPETKSPGNPPSKTKTAP